MLLPTSLIYLTVLAIAAEAALFTSKNVRILTSKDFNKRVGRSDKLTIASFTAPWCGHCKTLSPEFDKAADNLQGLVNLVNVDCDADINKQFCGEMGVKGFPTIKVFPGGSAPSTSYDGPRTAKGIVDYAIGRMPSFVKKVGSAEILEGLRIKSEGKPISLLFTSAATVTPMYKALSTTFHKSMDFFAAKEATVGKDAMETFGVRKVPSLVVLKDGAVIIYDGHLKLEDIKAFLKPISDSSMKPKSAKVSPKAEL